MKFSGSKAPLPPPCLRAPAPPREISPLRSQVSAFRFQASAFTLLEVLVAVTILAVMMTFLFNLLGSSVKLWETGNKRIEAAQAARVGLNIMARDLQNAFAGNMTSYTSSGTEVANIAPFKAIDSPSTALGLGGGAISSNGSQQLCGITLSGNATIPYNEFGYFNAFIANEDGISPMIGKRSYLVKKVDIDNVSTTGGNLFFRDTAPDATWYGDSTAFYPIIDNCLRMTLEYYGNASDPDGVPTWSSSWSPEDRLPLGVLVTVTVLDSRTAIKVAQLESGDPIASANSNVQRLITQGAVTMSRFIPLNRN